MKRTWALFAVLMFLFLGTVQQLPAYHFSTVTVSDPDSCTCDIEIAASLPQDEPFFFWDGYATVDSLNLAAYLLFPQDMTPPGSCVADLEYGDGCQPDFAACGGDTIKVALYNFAVIGWGPDLFYTGTPAPPNPNPYQQPLQVESLYLNYSKVTVNATGPPEICWGSPFDFKVTAMQGQRDISSQAVTTVTLNGVTVTSGSGQYPMSGITKPPPATGPNVTYQFVVSVTGCGCESTTKTFPVTVMSTGCVGKDPNSPQVNPNPPSCLFTNPAGPGGAQGTTVHSSADPH